MMVTDGTRRNAEFTIFFLLMASAAALRPGVGVGVFVRSPDHPGKILLGQRLSKIAAGVGTWALPGGHLEHGESWAACAAREVKEETGLDLVRVRVGTVLNVVDEPSEYHYMVVFMVGDAVAGATPINAEPDKCAGWVWHRWSEELPKPLFRTLHEARKVAFDPFAAGGHLLQDAHAELPPYCCCILHEATGAVLLEQRGTEAKVAAGQLTCFGGKREADEPPLDCITRELKEELGVAIKAEAEAEAEVEAEETVARGAKRAKGGVVTVRTPRRAVDLYVDGELIAWFFEAPAPARDAPLAYEVGRAGVWLDAGEEDDARLSKWHAAVLKAWRRGERRADFETPSK